MNMFVSVKKKNVSHFNVVFWNIAAKMSTVEIAKTFTKQLAVIIFNIVFYITTILG